MRGGDHIRASGRILRTFFFPFLTLKLPTLLCTGSQWFSHFMLCNGYEYTFAFDLALTFCDVKRSAAIFNLYIWSPINDSQLIERKCCEIFELRCKIQDQPSAKKRFFLGSSLKLKFFVQYTNSWCILNSAIFRIDDNFKCEYFSIIIRSLISSNSEKLH